MKTMKNQSNGLEGLGNFINYLILYDFYKIKKK